MRLSRLLYNVSKHIEYYSKFQPTSFTLKNLLDFAHDGDIKQSYKFLRGELLVRWSHMRKEMKYLSPKLIETTNFKLIISMYDQSFSEIIRFKTLEPEATTLRKFTETLIDIRKRHINVVPILAQGLMEYEKENEIDSIERSRIEYFFDRFFINRIGVRTLISQHTILFGDELPQNCQQAGNIDPSVDVVAVLQDAYLSAKHLFEQIFSSVPEIEIISHNKQNFSKDRVTIVYIPSHIHYILYELLKNSIRATIERHGFQSKNYPPIRVRIAKGYEDLTIQIEDCGTGISHSKISKLFRYMDSTTSKSRANGIQCDAKGTPFAGLSYGLPVARLYARYFQGDLKLVSIDNFGTSAYVLLKATAENAREFLPIFRTSRYSYTTVKGSDWTMKTEN